jgi:hypothetical protein
MQATEKENKRSQKTQAIERPRHLSKAAIWRQNNPGGILIVVDRRAVNR